MVAEVRSGIIRSAALTCLVLSSVLHASGCASHTAATSPGAGSLNSTETLSDIDPRLAAVTGLAARITYTSTSGINDRDYKVTAAVFVPKGDAPPEGWPMVAFGHRATGIHADCAPSLSPTLLGESGTVTELVKA
ncbi:MAG TPA: hypothetical protein VMU34_10755, partial [Mycobacterium sp.]|nr:hypothetical protein [Mycobacterium sp.]